MQSTMIKLLVAVCTLVAAIVSTAILIDERYAHAADVQSAQRSIETNVQRASLENRKWFIEDRLQSLEVKPEAQRTDYDRAQIQRYTRDLQEVNRAIRAVGR